MSKVLIAVMAAKNSISERNIKGIQESYVRWINEYETKHEYTVVVYDGEQFPRSFNPQNPYSIEKICDSMYHLTVYERDDVYSTYEKTLAAFNAIVAEFEFDYIVRVNISTYISIPRLDAVVDQIGDDIYCNAINAIITSQKYLNDIYPRGDFWMMSIDTFNKIREHEDEALTTTETLDHVDDVLWGVAIINTFGRDYVDRLKALVYSFIPGNVSECETLYNKGTIASRVKGVPKGQHSGYSWGDNQYRKLDPLKMKKLYEIDTREDGPVFENINSLLQTGDEARKVMIVQFANASVDQLKAYLKTKK